jgi:dipeptidyl aminopeptidase/acylaminoacyl peptidase
MNKIIIRLITTTLTSFLLLISCNSTPLENIDEIITVNQVSPRTKQIFYRSDGLKIEGFITYPSNFNPKKKYPFILFNRGGNRSFGEFKIPNDSSYLEKLSLDKYIVLNSQYRGSLKSEGNDEFGGADINDSINLYNIALQIPYIDKLNRFNVGESRGGMMSYLLLKNKLEFNATIIGAGISNLESLIDRRDDMKEIISELILNFKETNSEAIKSRSAIFWPDLIKSPLLLVHGDKDWRVDISNSTMMAKKLKMLGKQYKLIVFKNEDHSFSKNQNRYFKELHKWLLKYTINK